MDSIRNEIIPMSESKHKGLQKIVDLVHSIARRKEFNSTTARSILQLVVNTNENSLNNSSDLNRLGPYSVKELRQALRVIALEVFRKYGGEPTLDNFLISKQTNTGEPLYFGVSSNHDRVDGVSLQLGGGEQTRRYLIVTHIPTQEPKNSMEQFYAGVFRDLRPGHDVYAQPNGEFDITEYRKSWLGFRWLAENLLRWDEGFKLPEEL